MEFDLDCSRKFKVIESYTYCCDYSSTQSQSSPSRLNNNNVIKILQQCGLIESLTNPDLHDTAAAISSLSSSTLKVYCGFDPTTQSLHLGNLLSLIVFSWFHCFGHQPVALIGDPSRKSLERFDLNLDSLCRNTLGILSSIARILFENSVILNNYEWWQKVKLLDFLKDVGKYARVGTTMAKESVKKRLESEQRMSYIEFPLNFFLILF
ncbi:hypothetical protein SO802_019894 [Lithocarpus litseifolius]|uniref:Tyrosine--tRNA ligase n=1 Tax=Lithocarpus litseifolius TaxID=425828 RepID=A0AAW2CPX7_9ROSI